MIWKLPRSRRRSGDRSRRLVLEHLEDRAVPAVFTWVNGEAGTFAFSDAANWRDDQGQPGVPGPGDSAVASVAADVTIRVDSPVSLTRLDSTERLRVVGGGGLTVTSGESTVAGGLDLLPNGRITADDGATLFLSGANTLAGRLDVQQGATLVFTGGAATRFDPGVQFTGAGTFRQSLAQATGELRFTTNVTLPADWEVLDSSGATFRVDPGVTVTAGGSFLFDAPATLALGNGSTFVVPAGSTAEFRGGAVTGTGGGNLTVTAGGHVVLDGPTGSSLNLTGVTVSNTGTWDWSGPITFAAASSQFTNQIGGTFTVGSDATFGSATATFRNLGTFTRSSTAGPGATTFAGAFENTGSVQVASGSLRLDGGGAAAGGFTLADGATLAFTGGSARIDAGSSFGGAGGIELAGGTLELVGSPTLARFLQTGGTLTGSGQLTVTGTLDWTGGRMEGAAGRTVVPAGATLTLAGNQAKTLAGRSLDLGGTGTLDDSGNLALDGGGKLSILAGATFTITGDADFTTTLTGSIASAGTLAKTGAGVTDFGSVAFANNQGTLDVQAGTVKFNANYTQNAGTTALANGATLQAPFLLLNGGTLRGSGVLDANLINDAGTVRPGGDGAGMLTIDGTFVQNPLGTTAVDLGGTTAGSQYDRLAVTGTATLGGTLAVRRLGEFAPTVGDTFQVVTFPSHSGSFASITGLSLANAQLKPTLNATDLTLVTTTLDGGPPGQLQFLVTLYSAAENSGVATITVTREEGTSGPVSVQYATADGSAVAGQDYTASTGTLTWGDGDGNPRSFTVALLPDDQPEGNETVLLSLFAPTGGATLGTSQATLRITEDLGGSGAPHVQFALPDTTALESGGQAVVVVTRSGSTTGTVSVNYATSDGSAVAGQDYVPASGTLTFGPGQTSVTFVVTINDNLDVGDETINLSLSNPGGGATLGTPATATLTLIDDTSTQIQRYVNQLYLDLLGRPADGNGLSFWGGNLQTGQMPRENVVAGIMASREYRTRTVRDIYQKTLGREADSGGLLFFENLLALGGNAQTIRATLFASDEYFRTRGGSTIDGFLQSLYRDALGRDVDPTGLTFFRQLLQAGGSRTTVAATVIASNEGLRFLVNGIYTALLRREADPGGLNFFTTMLQAGAGEDRVVATLAASNEYFGNA